MGHGDAFFSIGMALLASWETGQFGFTNLGDLQGFLDPEDPAEMKETGEPPAFLEPELDPVKEMALPGGIKMDYTRAMNPDLTMADCPNPTCDEIICKPEFWVPERKLCIYCGHRG